MKRATETTLEEDAERLMMQRLVLDYLDPTRRNFWKVDQAAIEGLRVHNRYGLPEDAETWRYDLVHPAAGWGVRVRAVWCAGGLVKPVKTHVRVEAYHDLTGEDVAEAARARFRAWLRGLDL